MRELVAAALVAMSVPVHAAMSFSTDVTDLWWNPDESGWGVNVIQQAGTVFATFFVYDTSGRAHWYVASDMAGSTSSPGSATFTGTLYESAGPYFGVNFNPAAVSRAPVGTATLQFALPNSGVLTYVVNNTSVTKQIVRQTWGLNDLTGQYSGWRATRVVASGGCTATTGPATLTSLTSIEVAQSASTFNLRGVLGNGGGTCTFTGDYSQQGHLGASSGSYTCTSGLQGTYRLSEIEGSPYGFFARFSATERGCPIDGRMGAVRTAIRQVAQ